MLEDLKDQHRQDDDTLRKLLGSITTQMKSQYQTVMATQTTLQELFKSNQQVAGDLERLEADLNKHIDVYSQVFSRISALEDRSQLMTVKHQELFDHQDDLRRDLNDKVDSVVAQLSSQHQEVTRLHKESRRDLEKKIDDNTDQQNNQYKKILSQQEDLSLDLNQTETSLDLVERSLRGLSGRVQGLSLRCHQVRVSVARS